MLSDRDALLAAIRDHPEEDTPRLMFADWLDEQGGAADTAHAEFIRLQCELARLTDDGSDSQPVFEFIRDHDWITRPTADWPRIDDGIHRRLAFAMRSEDLFKRHAAAWMPKFPKKFGVQWVAQKPEWLSSCCHRGFPQSVQLNSFRNIGEIASRLRAAAPSVTLIAEDLTARKVEQLAEAGLLGWVRGLELVGECAAGLRAFGHYPEAADVRSLSLQTFHEEVAVGAVAALCDSPHWTGLHVLALPDTPVPREPSAALLSAKNLFSLRRLVLGALHDCDAETLHALRTSPFSRLISLSLSRLSLGDEAAEALASNPSLRNLRSLSVSNCGLSGLGITALITSLHLENVAFLSVDYNSGHGLDAKRLANAAPGALRMFHAHGCRLRTPDVKALARCPRMRALWYLDLDDNNIGTPAVRELVRGLKEHCPPILWLTHNRIDDRGAELLANWPAAHAMSVLHLRYNPITDEGVKAIHTSKPLKNLDGLGIDTHDAKLHACLRRRFRGFDAYYG